MRFRDFFDIKKGPETIIRLALYPLFILIVGCLVMGLVSRMNNTELLLGMVFLVLLSPLAYVLREQRRGHRQLPRARRGAERTPLMPHEEDVEEGE